MMNDLRHARASRWANKVTLALLLGAACGALSADRTNAADASVSTSKAVYAVGETVSITGSGWTAGETVSLEIAKNSLAEPADTLYAVANDSGDITQEYVPQHAGQFTLTAAGSSSGSTQAAFSATEGVPQDAGQSFALTAAGSSTSSTTSTTSPGATIANEIQYPSIGTDKYDYVPGEIVFIAGANWLADELVSLDLLETPLVHPIETLYSTADAAGNITNEYVVQDHDLGQQFTLTATGQTSGYTVVTTFADGPPADCATNADCDDTNACTIDSCNQSSHHCQNTGNNGAACSDGKACTDDICVGVNCVGTPDNTNTCTDGNACTDDVCSTGNCVSTNDNTNTCSDGIFCNGTDGCSSGACTVHAGDPCPGPDGDGNCSESCNEGADNCTAPDANGSACNDGMFCNGTDTCSAGACTVHTGDPCPGPDGDGNCSESCDEGADNCTAADADGSACDDDTFCNGTDTCSAGACTVHTGDPCPGPNGDNNCAESCDEDGEVCTANDPDGSACDDGAFCNGTETCTTGVCGSSTGDPCPGPDGDDDCAESCSEANDNCLANDTDGSACNDGTFCNGTETCTTGVCGSSTGDPCPGPDGDDDCAESCSEANDNCLANDTDGSACDDGTFCNGTETCTTGVCGSSTGDPCPGPDGDDDCAESCSEANDNCLANDTDGSACDDGTFCDGTETCTTGVCGSSTGDPCPGPDGDDDCAESCSEANGNCLANDTDGSACDDGAFCTATDTCSGGTCSGTGDPCVGPDGDGDCTESCDEAANDCEGTDADGSACDDGVACTVDDACSGGVCSGTPTDSLCNDDYSCTADSCDAESGCVFDPQDSECNDSNVCTDDACDPDDTNANEDTGCVNEFDTTNGCVAEITNSSLCPFDIDPDHAPDSQFKLILTPDQNSVTAWKLNASNPGQFYYNGFYVGAGNTTFKITLPYPFVTQGAVPVHVYSAVSAITSAGCFVPGAEIKNAATTVSLTNYSPQQFGSTKEVSITLPSLPNGFAYITIHLDYGLKPSANYSKDASNNAIDATNLAIRILDNQSYSFSDTGGGSDTAQSKNVFKRDPGFAGLVLSSLNGSPVPNVRVQIYDSANKLLQTVKTDEDGWYMWQYKYTGKAATFTIKLPDYPGKSQSVTLKSNGFMIVSFNVP